MQTDTTEPNPYEVAARQRKVSAMVAVIDSAALAKGINPHSEPNLILDAFERWTEQDWKRVDRLAKLKTKSSAKTRAEVVETYKKRDELPF